MSELIDAAIAAGKFSERRRSHYERLYADQPEATERLIASLHAIPEMASEGRAPRIFAGGLFDESRMAIEFQDTQVTPSGVVPALGSRGATPTDTYAAEPLPWSETRPHKRITMGD
jgi:hypothetical protein